MATNSPSDLDFLTRFAITESEEGCHNVLARPDFASSSPTLSGFTSKEKGILAIRRLKRVFDSKCYVTKEPLLYALARIIRNTPISKDHDEDDVREGAYKLALQACESPMDLFTFVDYDKAVVEVKEDNKKKAGWGRGMKKLVRRYYEKKSPLLLASEVTKCKSGRGWTHKDLIRLSHIRPDRKSKGTSVVLNYLANGKKALDNFKDSEEADVQEVVTFLKAIESLKCSKVAEKEVIRSLVEKYKLVDRQIPSHLLQLKETFEGLIGHMDLEDVFRNVPKMASLGMLDQTAPQATHIIDRVKNFEAIKDQKVPPAVIFIALRKYETNKQKKWIRNHQLVKALHAAFNVSLQNLTKIGKRILLAIHIDSKITKQRVAGANYLTPIMACALMARYLTQTDEKVEAVFFHQSVVELKIRPKMAMAAIVECFVGASKEGGGNQTYDISEPIKWALQKKKLYDNILIISDKKNVSSQQDFYDAINNYRSTLSLPETKLAFIGMSDFTSVVNKNDLRMLEISGFNERIPPLIYNFFSGHLDFPGDDEDIEDSAQGGAAAAP